MTQGDEPTSSNAAQARRVSFDTPPPAVNSKARSPLHDPFNFAISATPTATAKKDDGIYQLDLFSRPPPSRSDALSQSTLSEGSTPEQLKARSLDRRILPSIDFSHVNKSSQSNSMKQTIKRNLEQASFMPPSSIASSSSVAVRKAYDFDFIAKKRTEAGSLNESSLLYESPLHDDLSDEGDAEAIPKQLTAEAVDDLFPRGKTSGTFDQLMDDLRAKPDADVDEFDLRHDRYQLGPESPTFYGDSPEYSDELPNVIIPRPKRTEVLSADSWSQVGEEPPAQPAAASSEKKTLLAGHALHAEANTCYHSVKGTEVWGLIYDPGAADGLAGTQTLLEYLQSVVWPAGRDQQKRDKGKFSSYSGIDGKSLPAGHRSAVPFNFGAFEADFDLDTIGRSGDKCPFLCSNASDIRMKNIFMAAYYDNGDALLIFPNLKGKCYGLRLPLTDSGH